MLSGGGDNEALGSFAISDASLTKVSISRSSSAMMERRRGVSVFSSDRRRARDHFADRARRAIAKPKNEGIRSGRKRTRICYTSQSRVRYVNHKSTTYNVARESELETRWKGYLVVEAFDPSLREELRLGRCGRRLRGY